MIDLGGIFVKVRADLSHLTVNLKNGAKHIDDWSKNVQTRLQVSDRAFTQLGRRVAMAGSAITASLGLALKSVANFQEQMVKVSTMLTRNNMAWMPQYADAVEKMALEFGISTQRIADSLYEILKAGVAPSEALGELRYRLVQSGAAADTVGKSFGQIKQTFIAFGRDIGQSLKPALDSLAKTLLDILEPIRDWIKEHPKLTQKIVEATAAIGLLAIASGTFLATIMPLKMSLAILSSSFLSLFRAAALAWGAIFSPVGVVIAAIAAVAAAAYTMRAAWNENLWGIQEKWQAFKDWLLAGWQVIADAWSNVCNYISDAWHTAINALVRFLTDLLTQTIASASAASEFIKSLIKDRDWELANKIAKNAYRIVMLNKEGEKVIESVKVTTGKVMDGITDVAVFAGEKIGDAYDVTKEGAVKVAEAIQELGAAVGVQFDKDMEKLKTMFPKVYELLNLLKGIESVDVKVNTQGSNNQNISAGPGYQGDPSRVGGMVTYMKKLRDDMVQIGKYISDKWAEVAESIEGSMSNAFQGLITGAKSFKESMANFFQDIANAFAKMISDMIARAVMFAAINAMTGGTGGPIMAIAGMAQGGLVKPVYAAGGMLARGSDTVPAMLTPGELVIPKPMTDKLRSMLGSNAKGQSAAGGGVTINIVNPMDGQSVMAAIQSQAVKAVLRNNGMNGQIRTMIREQQ